MGTTFDFWRNMQTIQQTTKLGYVLVIGGLFIFPAMASAGPTDKDAFKLSAYPKKETAAAIDAESKKGEATIAATTEEKNAEEKSARARLADKEATTHKTRNIPQTRSGGSGTASVVKITE